MRKQIHAHHIPFHCDGFFDGWLLIDAQGVVRPAG
jgi:hypothetical protein